MHGADGDGDEDRVYGITTAETSHTQEITRRQKQYILTMLVRVVSIIVVVAVPAISWPVKIGLCLVATIIPYVAVVRANGGPNRESGPTNLVLGPQQRELGPAERGLPRPGEGEDFIVIVGEPVFHKAPEADDTQEAHETPATSEAQSTSDDDDAVQGEPGASPGPARSVTTPGIS